VIANSAFQRDPTYCHQLPSSFVILAWKQL
jgi:hypothetical protein